MKVVLKFRIYLLSHLLYRWIIYIELLYWGDRMRGWGRFRLVILYANIYALLLYYDRH